MYTAEGTETHDTTQTLTRWTQWIQQHFSKPEQENNDIQIEHIKEQTWGKIENALKQNATTPTQPTELFHPNLKAIREHAQLIKAQQKSTNRKHAT